MKRMLPIFGFILLGALAVAIGMGLYLKQANADRERLAQTAIQAQQAAQQAKDESEQTVAQANQKISQAKDQLTKMQDQLKAIENERVQMTTATALVAPTGRAIKGWKEAVDVPLSISVQYPPNSHVETNDNQSLTLVKDTLHETEPAAADARWLSITPYDVRLEQELLATLASSTAVSYVAHGRLLLGELGTVDGTKDTALVLRAQLNGNTTHLVWVRGPVPSTQKTSLLDVVSTLNFPQ